MFMFYDDEKGKHKEPSNVMIDSYLKAVEIFKDIVEPPLEGDSDNDNGFFEINDN